MASPPAHVGIAPRSFSDWPRLLALLRESFATMAARIDPPSSLDAMGVDELVAKASAETLILAMEGPDLVGCAFAAVREDCVYVGKIAVAAKARGKGIARAMLEVTEGLARKHGRPFVELQTRVELVENHAAFGALGFVKVGETAHPGYTRATSITMRRPVREAALGPGGSRQEAEQA